jgi:transcription antitermination factor NusG
VSDGAKLYLESEDVVLNFTVTSGRCAPAFPRPLVTTSSAHWYAAYTRANHEKRVAEQLLQRSVEHFFPCYNSVRRWKDRKVCLQMPLFPGYIFVRIELRDQMRVREIPSVASLVGTNGIPTSLPDEEIHAMRRGFVEGVSAQPHPYLTVGRRARVIHGPLAGFQGIVLKRRNRTRFVVALELIRRSVAVEIDPAELEPIL